MASEEESYKSIEMWILEHACKTWMEKVIDEILKKKKGDLACILPNLDGFAPSFSQNGVYLTILLRCIEKELFSLAKDIFCNPICCKYDVKLSSKTVVLMEKLFSECHFLPLKLFTNMITRLRLLELVAMIIWKEDSNKIMEELSTSFPKANLSFKAILKRKFKLENPRHVEQMVSAYSCCRKYVVQLMAMSEERRDIYVKVTLPKELAEFATAAHKYLLETRSLIASQLPQSPLEQILAGGSEDLKYLDDSNIQVLLKFLTPGITEDNLLNLLKELDEASEMALSRVNSHLENICSDNGVDVVTAQNIKTPPKMKRPSESQGTPESRRKKSCPSESPESVPSKKEKVKVQLRATPSSLADRYFSFNNKEEEKSPSPKKNPKKKAVDSVKENLKKGPQSQNKREKPVDCSNASNDEKNEGKSSLQKETKSDRSSSSKESSDERIKTKAKTLKKKSQKNQKSATNEDTVTSNNSSVQEQLSKKDSKPANVIQVHIDSSSDSENDDTLDIIKEKMANSEYSSEENLFQAKKRIVRKRLCKKTVTEKPT